LVNKVFLHNLGHDIKLVEYKTEQKMIHRVAKCTLVKRQLEHFNIHATILNIFIYTLNIDMNISIYNLLHNCVVYL